MEEEIEAFRKYLMDLERSENTISAYIWSIRIFFRQYREINRENMLEFKRRQLEQWKPKTACNRVVALNQFCMFLGHAEYCVKGIRIHQSASVENVISIEEYRQLLAGLKRDGNERGYWLISFLAHTGARVSEFVRLTGDGLTVGYCEMWSKGKMRRIYIPQSLIRRSRKYFQRYFQETDTDLLFVNRQGSRLTSRGIDASIRRWAKKYGIRKEVAHPHSFRHLFAIEFLKKNSNIALLADLMGHSSVSTTSIYLKLSREEQMRQFNDASDW
ncbi:MAG: tyrosine-type recombinase/integrase [Lachnospiraceae bacterium]|nr:tyrosine-type recombinase/integrase [Lachnospiraceae bacterium]